MKVLTLTTQYAKNMGALLQCYALCAHLNKYDDVDCSVIDYYPDGAMRSWAVFRKPRSLGDFLNVVLGLLPSKLIRRAKSNKVFRDFIISYIKKTDKSYHNRKEILDYPPKADAFICGSDQIWNFRFRRDLTFFFDFVDEKSRKIAYAPSIAHEWSKQDQTFIQPYLARFNAISIRDKGLVKSVNELVPDKTVHLVCDPVFLLSQEEWIRMADTSKCPTEPYILCYFIATSEFAVKSVQHIRKITGYKVVYLNVNARDNFNSDIHVTVGGPRDLVGLVSNAAFVCTNSFHCTSFSVIFQKDFAYLKESEDERAKTICDIFKLQNAIKDWKRPVDFTRESLKLNYEPGKGSGKEFIEQSKHFLEEAIWPKSN